MSGVYTSTRRSLKSLFVARVQGKIKYAQFLHDASELQIREPSGHHMREGLPSENDLNLSLPVNKPNVEIPVIELFLKD